MPNQRAFFYSPPAQLCFILLSVAAGCTLPCLTAIGQVTSADIAWDFECGSLQYAQTVQINELNLTLRLDDATGDLYGWYYFKILQNAAGQMVTFHVLNPDGWINAAHQPVYSENGGQSWGRIEDTWMASGDFHFRRTFVADSAEIALAFPYSYSRLLGDLDVLTHSPYADHEFIGLSVHDRQIPLLTITDMAIPDIEKRVVWLMSRQHAMETPTSFVLQGLMEFLLSESDLAADRMRRTTIFKITPMINVDGVAEGYSRHNVNGVNLNRCWAYDSLYVGEQPEVNAAHQAIDEWVYDGHSLDLFNDFHCAPDLYDFGYKLSAVYSYPQHYQDETTFTKHLDTRDSWQNWTLWRDLDSAYGSGLVTMALYQQHDIVGLSSENSWSRRANGQYITIPTLAAEGIFYALAIDDYLHPIRITDAAGTITENLEPGDQLFLRVNDPDQNLLPGAVETVAVTAISESNLDTETITLSETGVATGIFANSPGVPIWVASAAPGDGAVQVAAWDRIMATYVDANFPRDSSWAIAHFQTMNVVLHPRHGQYLGLESRIAPNPFNAETAISFKLSALSYLNLGIYDTAGRLVGTLVNGWREAGIHEFTFDASALPSGVYFYRLTAGEQTISGKVVLLK